MHFVNMQGEVIEFPLHQENDLSRLESRPTLPTVTYGPDILMLANRHILLSSCRRFQTAKTSLSSSATSEIS